MTERGLVHYGNTAIEYTVIRSARRRKTVAITLDHGAGVLVAAPVRTTREQIRQIVLRRAGWIVRRAAVQAAVPGRKEFVSGESLPYLGQEARLLVEHASGRWVRVGFEPWAFHITVPAALDGEARRTAVESAVVRWYRARAEERLRGRTEHWAQLAGSLPTSVLVRDQRRRWGSCGPDGKLRFNWRLVMAPPALIDYVVVHELVHLRVRNHSAAFWAEVARLMPDYKARRAKLKEVGASLAM